MVATRTVAATVYGFSVAGDLGREVAAARAVTTQLGYLVGSLAGGAAFALGGFPALAVAFGGLLLASTLPYLSFRFGRQPAGHGRGGRQRRRGSGTRRRCRPGTSPCDAARGS